MIVKVPERIDEKGGITLMFNPAPTLWGLPTGDVYDDFIREELLLLLLERPATFAPFDHVKRMNGGSIRFALEVNSDDEERQWAALKAIDTIRCALQRATENELNPQVGYTGIGSTLGDLTERVEKLPIEALILLFEIA